MELLLFPVEDFQAFLICLARVAGFMSAIPVFFGAQAPVQVKTALTLVTAIVLFPVMGPFSSVIPFEPIPFSLFVVNELLLGAIIGLVARFIFTAVQFGGTVIGFQMGFGMANVLDPQSGQQTALISQFQNVFAILIFLSLDGHHLLINTAVRSFELLPPGQLNLSDHAVPYLFELSSHMFLLGVQFSAPVIAILLLSGLCLGILSRVFPQLNVFLLSFPLNISISLIVIGLTLNMMYMILSREFDDLPNRLATLLRFLN